MSVSTISSAPASAGPNASSSCARPRIAVRLKRDDQPAAERRARGGQHRGDLGRVMAVVVDHQHAARFAVALESALGAVEPGERVGDAREVHADALRRPRPRPARSAGCAGRARPARAGRAAPSPSRVRRCTWQRPPNAPSSTSVPTICALRMIEAVGHDPPPDARQDRGQVRVVGARDHAAVERHLVREVEKRLLQIREAAAVALHVLVVDVGHHRDRRPQHQERPIAFIRFRHHVLAASEPRVAAERAQPPADHRRRIQSAALEHQRNHRGRRRLAVRARRPQSRTAAASARPASRRAESPESRAHAPRRSPGCVGRTADETTTTSASPT